MSCRSSLFLTLCPPIRGDDTAGEPPVGHRCANPLATCFQAKGSSRLIIFFTKSQRRESRLQFYLCCIMIILPFLSILLLFLFAFQSNCVVFIILKFLVYAFKSPLGETLIITILQMISNSRYFTFPLMTEIMTQNKKKNLSNCPFSSVFRHFLFTPPVLCVPVCCSPHSEN